MKDPPEDQAPAGTSPESIDEDELSEQLDDDKLAGDFPPDRPQAVEDYGITPQEERVQEPLEERVERENPERMSDGEVDAMGTVVEPDEGVRRDDEASMIADEAKDVPEHDRPLADVGTDDATTHGTVLDRSDEEAAEDAAVHERPEP